MSTTPPDQILDVRVTVPVGWHVNKVTATQDYPPGSDNPLWLCAIEAINPAIDRRPLFPGAIDDPIVDPHCVLERQIEQESERVDNLEKHCEAMQGKIEVLQNDALDLSGWVDRLYERLPDKDAPNPPKPTIKGGWVNVYRYDRVPVLHVSPILFKTRAECDSEGTNHRIACIHIPDIQEGEGR